MGERGPRPGEGGAPRKVIDLDVARRASSLGCTSDEIASLLGIGRRTFYDHLEKDEGLKEAIDEGRAQGRVTLRRLQWQQAHAGNPTMLIWLGKQLLGQRDKVDLENNGQSLTLLHLAAAHACGEQLRRQYVIENAATENQEKTAVPINPMEQAAE
jgi:hypothetical protein